MLNRNKSRKNGQQYNHLNTSILGAAGYELVYNKAHKGGHPDADFISFKDKWFKKSPAVWAKSSILTVFVLDAYLRAMRLVAEHYISAVGRFYNCCVVLTNYVYLKKDKIKDLTPYKIALACAWRLLYEGLGLAGWSPNARLFLALLTAAAFGFSRDPMNPRFTLEADDDWGDTKYGKIPAGYKPVSCRKDTPESKKYPALGYLAELMDIKHISCWKKVTRLLVWATKVSFDWSALEGGRDRVAYMMEEDINLAYVMGAIRRAGQGKDAAGIEELFAQKALDEMIEQSGEPEEEVILPTSCLRAIIQEGTYPGDPNHNKLQPWAEEMLEACPLVRETVEGAAVVHQQIENYLFGRMFNDEEL